MKQAKAKIQSYDWSWEKKDVLVRSWTEDEGEMIWMAKTTSYIFQNDENGTLHVKVDWWNYSSGKYKGKF